MRHLKGNKKLGKPTDQRIAMLRNIVVALVSHRKIKTTDARAKEARRMAEKLVSYGKEGSLHARRQALRLIPNEMIVKTVFSEIAPKYAERAGGYTRITKLAKRQGDAATLSVLEFVE